VYEIDLIHYISTETHCILRFIIRLHFNY